MKAHHILSSMAAGIALSAIALNSHAAECSPTTVAIQTAVSAVSGLPTSAYRIVDSSFSYGLDNVCVGDVWIDIAGENGSVRQRRYAVSVTAPK